MGDADHRDGVSRTQPRDVTATALVLMLPALRSRSFFIQFRHISIKQLFSVVDVVPRAALHVAGAGRALRTATLKIKTTMRN